MGTRKKNFDSFVAKWDKACEENEVDTAVFIEYIWRIGRVDSVRVVNGKGAYEAYLDESLSIYNMVSGCLGEVKEEHSEDYSKRSMTCRMFNKNREEGIWQDWGEAIYFKRK